MQNTSTTARSTGSTSSPQAHSGQARDFFLHLGSMVGLYAVAIALLNLLFSIINEAYPEVDRYYYSYPQISFPVATLIIIFPLFVYLSRLMYKTYESDPDKKGLGIRRWLTYITLFVAGIIFAGDLVYVLYKFLDGQDFTTAFTLKALSVLLVTGFVFKYYLMDIKETMTSKIRKSAVVASVIIILLAIVLGFSIIGSPATQRLVRYDNQKVTDLQNIQWQVVNYWQSKEVLPATLGDLEDPISSYMIPNDPQTNEPYEYNVLGELSFELCAMFNEESRNSDTINRSIAPVEYYGIKDQNWTHGEGRTCFERTIDPDLYTTTKPVR